MEPIYAIVFTLVTACCVFMEWPRRSMHEKQVYPAAFVAFRRNYLFVYSLMMAGDWLQGPYVYALYQQYGYSTGEIGKLFIAGFGSSMIFGTVVGSMADKYGRKKAALCYCVTYIASCVTKHWSDWDVLLVGRFFGGIATSLLFSAFESWVVSEHNRRGYEAQWLAGTFSKAVFLGNGLMAILAGLLANALVDGLGADATAPFDAAIMTLTAGGVLIAATWSENHGQRAPRIIKGYFPASKDHAPAEPNSESVTIVDQFRIALGAIRSDPRVGLLGLTQSLFEASMYTFVFLWTPALAPNKEVIPHGLIFATFMLSCMLGSSIASRLLQRPDTRPERYMQAVFLVAAVSLVVPVAAAFFPESKEPSPTGGISDRGIVKYLAFNVFEVCVGIFWPSMMKMRSQYVPENVRSTILNIFRLPLNLFICVVLYNVARFPLVVMFAMCAKFLILAATAQRRLDVLTAMMMTRSPSLEMEMLPNLVGKEDQ